MRIPTVRQASRKLPRFRLLPASTASTRRWQSAPARHAKQIFLEMGLDANPDSRRPSARPGDAALAHPTAATSGP